MKSKRLKGKITSEVSIAEQAINHFLHVTMRNFTEFERVPNRVFLPLIATDLKISLLFLTKTDNKFMNFMGAIISFSYSIHN